MSNGVARRADTGEKIRRGTRRQSVTRLSFQYRFIYNTECVECRIYRAELDHN